MENKKNSSSRTRKPFPKVEETARRAFNVTVNPSKVLCNLQFPFCSVGSASFFSTVKNDPKIAYGLSQGFQQNNKSQGSEKV